MAERLSFTSKVCVGVAAALGSLGTAFARLAVASQVPLPNEAIGQKNEELGYFAALLFLACVVSTIPVLRQVGAKNGFRVICWAVPVIAGLLSFPTFGALSNIYSRRLTPYYLDRTHLLAAEVFARYVERKGRFPTIQGRAETKALLSSADERMGPLLDRIAQDGHYLDFNVLLSGLNESSAADPLKTVVLFDDACYGNDSIVVMTLHGIPKRLTKSQFIANLVPLNNRR